MTQINCTMLTRPQLFGSINTQIQTNLIIQYLSKRSRYLVMTRRQIEMTRQNRLLRQSEYFVNSDLNFSSSRLYTVPLWKFPTVVVQDGKPIFYCDETISHLTCIHSAFINSYYSTTTK